MPATKVAIATIVSENEINVFTHEKRLHFHAFFFEPWGDKPAPV